MQSIKMVPNFITLLRIIGSSIIMFLKPFSVEFFIMYILCGLSDVMDGYIARKLNLSTKFGSKLDSIADTFFIIVTIFKVLTELKLQLWMILWIILIVVIRILSLIVLFIRFHEGTFLHTYLNKITGIALFFLALFYILLSFNVSIFVVCLIATLSALEELFINIIVKEVNLDIKGIQKIFSEKI